MANVHQLLKDLMEEIGPREQDVPTIGKLYKKWMNEAQRFRSMKSINAYRMTLTYIKASKPKGQHHKRKCNISNLQELSLSFKDYLDTRNLSPSSINSYLINLQTFYNWLKTHGYITERVGVQKIKVSEKSIKPFSEAQMEMIKDRILWRMENAVGQQKARKVFYKCHLRAYYVARYAGLRCGELVNLRLSDIDLDTREIWVRDVGDSIVKGAREESVPMSDTLYKFIKKDLEDRRAYEVWFLDTGFGYRAYSRSMNLSNAMKVHLDALGISGIKPLHGFRAAFCRNLGISGAPLPILKDLMRHKDLQTTLRYMDIHSPSDKLRAVNLLN